MNLKEEAEQLEDWIIGHRRYLHAHPELSFEEKETTGYIRAELLKLGVEAHLFPDYYGLYADLCGEMPSGQERTVLLRADIDALPIQEETGLPFCSKKAGVMHACGHDTHTAMLLGAAKLLSAHTKEFPGRVRLLFQAAEESCHGARYYVRKGILDGVDAVFGCHVWATLDAPYINLTEGARMSSCDNFTITVTGRMAHGAAPNEGTDAIVAAAAIIGQLQTIVSRRSDPRESLVLTVGEIEGGTRFNVIADRVVMKGTVRTHSAVVRENVEQWMRTVIEHTACACGAGAELSYSYEPGVLYNDPRLTSLARKSVKKLYGEEGLREHPKIMGSEDFSYYLEKAPGVYALIGGRNPQKNCIYPNHNPHFNVDESVLKRGAALYAQFAVDFLTDMQIQQTRRNTYEQ